MADLREGFDDPDEGMRSFWGGLQKHMHTALVSIIAEDSDGKTLKGQPTIKQQISDDTYSQTSYADFPLLLDVPVHHPGGGGVTHTFAMKAGDEILSIFSSRPIDTWFQSGGTQQPIADRMHSLSDGVAIPGVRSVPRELKQISTSTAQLRDDAKHHVVEHDPASGHHVKSVDPSTAPASDSFDPFVSATTFYEHLVKAATGILGSATDGGTTHTHGVTHAAGAFMTALNGLHSVLAHPQNGASLNAANLLHSVLAHPTLGAILSGNMGASTVTAGTAGVALQSATGISLSCPAGGLSLPAGGVGGGSLGAGAAASNVGMLGGDLAGSLPDPQVVGIGHVDAHLLPVATTDALAAAAGVPIGGLYRNTNFVVSGTYSGNPVTLTASGVSVVCVRMV